MPQPSTPPLPPPPTAPPAPTIEGVVAPAPGADVVGVVPPIEMPHTARELSALRSRRSELSRQLESTSERRDELSAQLKVTTGADHAGIEQRIQLLDQRILRLESELDATGRMIAAAPAELLAGSTSEPRRESRGGMGGEGPYIVGTVFTMFVLFPMAIAYARRMWRRPHPAAPTASLEAGRRLERLEQAVDAIAIEVERISEGQRFVTTLLSESRAEPARVAAPRDAT